MYESDELWRQVDSYFVSTLVAEDEALAAARSDSTEAGMASAEVAPNQGALLALFARMVSAHRVLEIGALAGYSTIWLARAVGADGIVVSLESHDKSVRVARRNLVAAGVDARTTLIHGPALESLAALIEAGEEPFDLVFIDADKPNNPGYLSAALQLTHPGSVIIADNVVRNGAVTDAESADPRVQGVRQFLQMIRDDPRLDATAVQTVGSKGWDGFAIALVR